MGVVDMLELCDVVDVFWLYFVVKFVWSNSNIVHAVVVEEHQEASLGASIGWVLYYTSLWPQLSFLQQTGQSKFIYPNLKNQKISEAPSLPCIFVKKTENIWLMNDNFKPMKSWYSSLKGWLCADWLKEYRRSKFASHQHKAPQKVGKN